MDLGEDLQCRNAAIIIALAVRTEAAISRNAYDPNTNYELAAFSSKAGYL